MGTAFYRATFEKQGTGSALGWKNCAAASGAMATDQGKLRIKDPSPDTFRAATGDFSGGLAIRQVGSTLEHYGVTNTVYDGTDGYTFDKLLAALKRGQFACVAGDYDQVPYSLRGDKGFDGLHTEYWHRVTSTGITVGDPLNDGRRAGIPNGYVTYPFSVARNYVEKLDRQIPGNSIHACVLDVHKIKSRGGNANVRADHTRASIVIGTINGTTRLVTGGTVTGQSINGNSTWFKVWFPAASKLGYCHSSVVVRV